MTKILNLELKNGRGSWIFDGQLITTSESGNVQILADEIKDLVFTLADGVVEQNQLNVFSKHGVLIRSLEPPEGYRFSYLTHHPEVNIAVVASADTKVDGWYDWHFGYDETKKELFRHCPAY